MKYMIEIGDKLKNTNDEGWYDTITGDDTVGPELNEVVTVRRFGVEYDSEEGEYTPIVWFDEYPGDALDDSFELCWDAFLPLQPYEK